MLHDILELERQIENDLVRERSRLEAWVQEQKEAIDRQVEQKVIAASSDASRSGENKCSRARKEAAARLRRMRHHLRQLRALPDSTLVEQINKRMPLILGEDRHDHPDG